MKKKDLIKTLENFPYEDVRVSIKGRPVDFMLLLHEVYKTIDLEEDDKECFGYSDELCSRPMIVIKPVWQG